MRIGDNLLRKLRKGKSSRWPYLILFLAGACLVCLGWVSQYFLGPESAASRDLPPGFILAAFARLQAVAMVLGILVMVAAPTLYIFQGQVSKAVERVFGAGEYLYVGKGTKRKALDLFLISFLGLFFEMLVIRWLSAEFRVFAYFKNLPLLAAFMGLGIGFALVRRRENLFPLAVPLITFLCVLVLSGSRTGIFDLIRYPAQEEFIWVISVRSSLLTVVIFCGAIVFFFLLTMVVFVPFGQLTGRLMNMFPPLTGYTINILGSLVGIWAFSAVSFLSLPPLYWFLIAVLLCLWFLQGRRYVLVGSAGIGAVCLALLFLYGGESLWSPYYRIDLDPLVLGREGASEQGVAWGYRIIVNQDYHQKALNLAPEFVDRYGYVYDEVGTAQRAYDLPYDFVRPRDVLVVGAGAGNDVASALRHGAGSVDAVEIDPLIADLGQRLHPEEPYRSSHVNVIIDDARSFFEKSDKEYDLIVFGFLDSHTLFSSMSSVRLDNFVYTIECLEEAKAHLKQDGMVALTFSVAKNWMGARLRDMLHTVFGADPLVFDVAYDDGVTFLAGPGASNLELTESHKSQQESAERSLNYQGLVPPSTDDWPYLYLRERQVPDVYWQVLLLLLVVSVAVVLVVFPESTRLNFHFFFLGCAFFLIETKSITETALLFGSTWVVNSVVISAILGMILAANLLVTRRRPADVRPFYALLLCSLLFNYAVPVGRLLGQNFLLRGVLSGFALSLPVFFAGIIFATSLRKLQTVELAFGSNLLGSVVGGMLEYSSLMFGIRSLYVLAAFVYLLSLLALRHKKV